MNKKNLWNKISHPIKNMGFKQYSIVSIPVILAAILYALNNFIDNFMVTSVDGGVAALSIANSWTGILLSIYLGVTFISSAVFGQYYGKKDFKHARDVLKFRILTALGIATVFLVIGLAIPRQLITVFSPNEKEEVIQYGVDYIRVITGAWFLLAFSYTFGTSLREIGHGKFQMYNSIIILATNVILNSALIYGAKMGVVGAAIASIAARIVGVFSNLWVLKRKEPELIISIKRIFFIDKKIFFLYWW